MGKSLAAEIINVDDDDDDDLELEPPQCDQVTDAAYVCLNETA